jgi:hypothetical protein
VYPARMKTDSHASHARASADDIDANDKKGFIVVNAFKVSLLVGFLFCALAATAFSVNMRQQPVTSRMMEDAPSTSIVGPTKDDPLKTGVSWARWPSLTDF